MDNQLFRSLCVSNSFSISSFSLTKYVLDYVGLASAEKAPRKINAGIQTPSNAERHAQSSETKTLFTSSETDSSPTVAALWTRKAKESRTTCGEIDQLTSRTTKKHLQALADYQDSQT